MKRSNTIVRSVMTALLLTIPVIPLLGPSPALADFGQAPAASFPKLVPSASSPEGFLQEGLKLEQVSKDDLDGDAVADLAMVIRMDDPKNVLKDPDDPERAPLDTNPRMIAIATADKGGSGYRLATVNTSLIPRLEDANMNDPFVRLSIDKGVMRLVLEQSMNAGSWSSSNITFVFRKGLQEMSLIGYDRTDLHRASGEMTETSVNFLTGRQQRSVGNIDSEKKATTWKQLPKKPLETLGMMGDGFSFDPLNP